MKSDQPLSCLIVDDEYPARCLLEAYVQRMPGLQLDGLCENGLEAIEWLRSRPVDLLFLDVQMPELSGIELLRSLAIRPRVILTTAYADYALEGYALEVSDYLVKPVSFERFVKAVNKAASEVRGRQAQEMAPAEEALEYFFVKVDYKLLRIRYADILFVEGMREYVNIQTAARRHIVYQSMKHMEEVLSAAHFARVHKSYIVALDKIDAIAGNLAEIGGKQIPIGKNYRDEFLRRIALL
jgi:DNA-binding LytR/AlgR family response regulator